MSQPVDSRKALSICLSRALDDIGLTEGHVNDKRQWLMKANKTIEINCFMNDINVTTYQFGSSIEYSTTIGLDSDVDCLVCLNAFNIIQRVEDWKSDEVNLLILQGGSIPTGYCRLQWPEQPLSITGYQNYFTRDSENRRLLKNSCCFPEVSWLQGGTVHGPARSTPKNPMHFDTDTLFAFKSEILSEQVKPRLQELKNGHWPTRDMLNTAEETGFFLVPVGHRESKTPDLEWRVSPSLTERCLMLGMNITQIKCYVVLKMLKKDRIIPEIGEGITSFHLKTVLFHCVQSTPQDLWIEENLVTCITICLIRLRLFVSRGFCPNFLIPGENLFSGKVESGKLLHLKYFLERCIRSEGLWLFSVKCDSLGQRLQAIKANLQHSVELMRIMHRHRDQLERAFSKCDIIACLCCCLIKADDSSKMKIVKTSDYINWLNRMITKLQEWQNHTDEDIKSMSSYLLLCFCSNLGSVLAAECLGKGKEVSRRAIVYLEKGIDCDLMSGRLKLASVLYCSGNFERAESVLEGLEKKYDFSRVQHVCCCHIVRQPPVKDEFIKCACLCNTDSKICEFIAVCVKFTPQEMHSFPPALVIEMWKGVGDFELRNYEAFNAWLDFAVVDSVTFMYYLMYLTHEKLGNRERQLEALYELIVTVGREAYYLKHVETALNLIGQCMENEHNYDAALVYYHQSLCVRPRNNAARWLIALLIYKCKGFLWPVLSKFEQW